MDANKASRPAMTKVLAVMRVLLTNLVPLACLVLLTSAGISTVEAGFRSPESLVRNVYAYYGDRSSDLSSGLPRDAATAGQFFDPKPAPGVARVKQAALRLSGPEPDVEARRHLDINPAQAIRQDLCRRRL
jgi:hypothetical protein